MMCRPIIQQLLLKVTVAIEGHQFECSISCFLQISLSFGRILNKLWSNVCHSEMICMTHDSTCWLKVKVTIDGREFEALILCQLHICFMPRKIFIIFWSIAGSVCQCAEPITKHVGCRSRSQLKVTSCNL